ncbi:MAG: T9SS type A sorting domain-containing protein [Bacteroidales bacterium]|nr:T9SS type A sorting domain-containing protein [Bacteroidales bacterium]
MRILISALFLLVLIQSNHGQLLGPEPFDSDFLVHGSSASTSVWFAPSSNTPIDYTASGGCTGGHASYSGNWNSYWGNFLRLPEVDASGLDSLKLSFDVSHSYFASQSNDWIRFYVWADGGYQKIVSAVRINGVDELYDFGVNGKGFIFDTPRTCAAVEVVFDLSTISNTSSILVYLEANCNYNNSNIYFISFDNISLASAGSSSFSVSCRADTSFCLNDAAWPISGSTPAGGTYSGAGVTSNIFFPSIAGIGSHSIKYVNDDGMGNSDSCYFNITVNDIPHPSIVVMPNDTLCNGESLILTATGAQTYQWDNGVNNGVSFTPSTQIYTVTATASNGCQNDTSVSVYVIPDPTVSLILPWDTLCATTDIPYPQYPLSGGNPTGGYYLGGDVIDSMYIEANGVPAYRNSVVEYYYEDAYGCSGMAIDSVYMDLCLTDIAENDNQNLILYPNPAFDNLNIFFDGEIQSVEIWSSDGKVMYFTEFSDCVNLHSVIVSKWPEGIYLLRIIDSENNQINRSFLR